jgi:hypothetical protein
MTKIKYNGFKTMKLAKEYVTKLLANNSSLKPEDLDINKADSSNSYRTSPMYFIMININKLQCSPCGMMIK